MTIPEDSLTLSKVKRVPDKMNFHQLLIFHKSGICIYKLDLSNFYLINEEQLISSYFTALMSFTKELVGTEIKAIEMSKNLKIVILIRNNFYYVILCDSIENMDLISDVISKLNAHFTQYIEKNGIQTDIEFVNDPDLDISMEEIINNHLSNEFDLIKEEKIIKFLKDLKYDDQINGIIFLTDLGQVIYSSINKVLLKKFLKEIEFRVKICNNSILKLFYTSKDNELIYSEYILNKYFIILIFDSKIRFGIAEFCLQKIVKTIEGCLTS